LGVASCALGPSFQGDRFVIYNLGDFTPSEVERVARELDVGARALDRIVGGSAALRRIRAVVNLRPGAGVSHSYGGQGAIELYWVREVQSPIIHELTHVLAGYTAANGHWTQEGFATYMQDEYGEDRAFPTYKMAHALAKVIREEKSWLPMAEVMKDRGRKRYFGLQTPWERWLAYAQSASFCRYLIETYGVEKFLSIYDLPFESIDFRGVYGRSVDSLIVQWTDSLDRLTFDLAAARRTYASFRKHFGRG
jgi:hypothetical protein